MNEIETINIQPSTNLIEVISTEYSFNSAIADLIDNCIDGNATDIKLIFELNDGKYNLHILDNGKGMSKAELKNAAIIGFKSEGELRNSNALGRYSTGLKSAASFLSNLLIVTSKTKNKKVNILKIDFSKMIQDGTWQAHFLDSFDKEKYIFESGTVVSCCNLKNVESDQQLFILLEGLRVHLSHVFGKFILSEKIKISLSTNKSKEIRIVGWNPFSLLENKSTKLVYSKPVSYKGKEISFKIYILPAFAGLSERDKRYMCGDQDLLNPNKLQGFYVYRSDRLIVEANWLLPDFDISDKSRYARIEVIIPSSLDKYFNVNLTKTKITIPSDLVNQFKNVGKKARTESNKSANYKNRPEIKPRIGKKDDTIWISKKTNNGYIIRLNKDNEMLKELCKPLSNNEFEQLINFISKGFPYDFVNSQSINEESYTTNEIESMTRKLYASLKENGLDDKSIQNKILHMEPFNKYFETVIDVFDSMEGEKNS